MFSTKIYSLLKITGNYSKKAIDKFFKIYYNILTWACFGIFMPEPLKYYHLVMEDENEKLIIHKTS